METVQQNGRFTLFSSKFLSIYSILYDSGAPNFCGGPFIKKFVTEELPNMDEILEPKWIYHFWKCYAGQFQVFIKLSSFCGYLCNVEQLHIQKQVETERERKWQTRKTLAKGA